MGNRKSGISRRMILVGGLAVGGGIAIGYALTPFSRLEEQRRLAGGEGAFVLNGAVRIGTDDKVTVIVPHADMGVGNGTALAQMLAEELDADWDQVRFERAPAELAFANQGLAQGFLRGDYEIPGILAGTAAFATRKLAEQMRLQITGGSTAIRFTGVDGMRRAGAAARHMLARAAASAWGVPVAEIVIAGGRISHASGKESGFGAFAEAALAINPPADLPLKDKKSYTISGQPKDRLDIPSKVDGTAVYGPDVRLPGMLFAAVRAVPVPGGSLASVDEAPARALGGVVDVVVLPDAVAVLADSHWRAMRAVYALEPQWSAGANADLDSAAMLAAMDTAVRGEKLEKDYARGDAAAAVAGATRTIEATYSVPLLAHAAMEPVGCVAHFAGGKLTVHGAFQDALMAKFHAAEVSGLPPEAVTIVHTEMGGAFGRRGSTLDYLDRAIAIARTTDRPVNLLFSREEDMTHDFYRNASVGYFKAGLGEKGAPQGIVYRYAEKDDPVEASQIAYDIADVDSRYVKGINKAPWGPWRSVDHSVHGFFIESFIDELAHAAGADPLEYRLSLLGDKPRYRAALEAVRRMSSWETPRGAGTGLGVAIVESFGTIVAEAAEVTVGGDGTIRVKTVWVAADPGEVVNPAGFARQMESGIIYGLSAALFGEISIAGGSVVQQNFPDYPVVLMGESPALHVEIIESGARMGGAGEPGTPPIAPAVANAIFAAIGVRARDLPLSKLDLRAAASPS